MPDPRFSKLVRDVVTHKVRTTLIVLSIAVGVFAILVVLGGRGILIESFDTNFPASSPANATLYTSDFGDELVSTVERQSGVRFAEGRRTVTLRYREGDLRGAQEAPEGVTVAERARSIEIVASETWSDSRVERVFPETGVAWPPVTGEIVLERSSLQETTLTVGDSITVDLGGGESRVLRIAGFAHDINAIPAMFVGRISGFVSMSEMPALDQPKLYNQLLVSMESAGLTRDSASRLAARLRDDVLAPRGVTTYGMSVPTPGSHFLGDIFRAVVVLLLALGVLALILSGFLVVNSVTALVSQQVRQVGVMKAIGARSIQIEWMYMGLVAVYGVLALLVGLPVGAWWAQWFSRYAAGILNFGAGPDWPPGYAIALAVAVGIVVPLAAAFVPVRNGTRISVVRALNSTGMSAPSFGHGWTDRLLGLVRGLPRPIALGVRNTFLRKGRLALTLTTLTLASAVVMSVMSVRSSILATVDDIASWWRYDVEVAYQRPAPRMPVETEVRKVPGVTAVESWLVHGVRMKRLDGTENEAATVIGLPSGSTFIAPKVMSGRWIRPDEEDVVVVNDQVANDEDLQIGDVRTFTVQGVERDWKIVGVVQGQLMEGVVFVERGYLERLLGEEGAVGRLVVRGSDHTDAGQRQLGDRIESRLKDAGMPVSSVRTSVAMSATLANELGILVTFLIIMAVILALVGIIGLSGTMIINVLESTREIGVMRAVGASHGSIYQVFVTEGVVVGVLSWAIGALFTYPMSLGLVLLLEKAITIPLTYEFSWTGVGVWLVVVAGISGIASLLPASRAARVSVRDAIAYE